MAFIAYVVLLFVWVLFLPAVITGAGSTRWWAAAACLAGLAALGWEAWMTFVWSPKVTAPIRLDVFLVTAVLVPLYGIAAVRVWMGDFRVTAALAAGVVALAALGVGWTLMNAAATSKLLTQRWREGNRLLFEAKFLNEEAYVRAFDMDAEPTGAYPVGHWRAPQGPVPRRLVVNPMGYAHLFTPCEDTECQFGPGAPLEVDSGNPGRWSARLVNQGISEAELTLETAEDGSLGGTFSGNPVRFEQEDPPLLGRPSGTALEYLGDFSAVTPLGQNVRVAQLWLWRDAEAIWGVGIFTIAVAGRRMDFGMPQVLGRGEPVPGGWRFRWTGPEVREAVLHQEGDAFVLELPGREARWPTRRLDPSGPFRDEVIELAPLTGAEDWAHWFDVQLGAHFSSGDMPSVEEARGG